MVERQYDLMKAERMRQLEEPAKVQQQPRATVADEHDAATIPPQPSNTASSATETQSGSEEVRFFF